MPLPFVVSSTNIRGLHVRCVDCGNVVGRLNQYPEPRCKPCHLGKDSKQSSVGAQSRTADVERPPGAGGSLASLVKVGLAIIAIGAAAFVATPWKRVSQTYADRAMNREAESQWATLQETDSLEQFRALVRDYPRSLVAEQARQIIFARSHPFAEHGQPALELLEFPPPVPGCELTGGGA